MRAARSLCVPLAFLLTTALPLAACRSAESPQVLAGQLKGVSSSHEEAAIFERLSRPGLGLAVYDAKGNRISMTDQDWEARTFRIVITVEDQNMSHVLINKKNLMILMRE
jgi:predicted secreted hydrolase